MLLLQFSTSHYCRKARLALGYKQIDYRVENLTPGIHALRLKPLTGLTTVPTLIPSEGAIALGDSTQILHFLDQHQPAPSLSLEDPTQAADIWLLEDWLDESIGTATRFVYYDYRAGEGKAIDPSWMSQAVIRIVRSQYGMTPAKVAQARLRLDTGLEILHHRWQTPFLVGDRLTAADIAAAALLSPLALIPTYRQAHGWLFDRITEIHHQCQEPLPPGLT
ncbi:glutathione S-transferase family protein [Leptolyngbya sp. CCY15150]|uniref:glutathione S-transferase family protein n=1 Tax=Leptolyngbya sp. CCY15150 TaxID=2767772 RepID=UPI00194EF2A3|nr:glutathione S-transferase family protein [Leptolyngbya sp. CCY15150]